MTLADVELPVTYQWAKAYALVFASDLAERLSQVQAQHGDQRHVPKPRLLVDGRWMLAADILTECQPGGLVYGGFSQLDSDRFGDIAVVPIAEALALLPPPEPLAP